MALRLSVAASAALIVGAHLFERLGNLPPCLLCLDQREAHWAVIAAGGATVIFSMIRGASNRLLAAALGALTLLYLFSAGLAGYHAGVEWGFWPGPSECAAGGPLEFSSDDDFLSVLNDKPAGPSCSEAAWRMFGISMAGYNALLSLALAGLALVSCLRVARDLRDDRIGTPAAAE